MQAKGKKIAIFIDGEFIPSFSGASNRFHYLSRALQKFTDTEVIIILCDRGWSDIGEIKKEEFETYLVHPSLFKDVAFLTKLLKNQGVNLVQFANLELAVEVGIPLAINLNVHLIFEAHYGDVEFAKAVGASRKTLENIVRMQNRFGKYFDKVIALSDDDIELAKNFRIPKREIAIIPSGVNLEDFPINCFNGSSQKVIFMGNLFFDANLVAVRKIKQTIYKKLKYKGYNFCIIGDIARDERKKLSDKNFIIMGRQQNLVDAFGDAALALAPISNGPGMRIKILNYLNAGIPVITTSQGARGFPRKDLLSVASRGLVYAFEPVGENFKRLEFHKKINKLHNIILENKAVSDRSKYAKIYLIEKNSGGHSLNKNKFKLLNEKIRGTEIVECITLREVFKKNNIKKCDFLKIDCEGEEFNILSKVPDSLFAKIDKISLEFHHPVVDEVRLGRFLAQKGFIVTVSNLGNILGMIFAKRKTNKNIY
jgi:FkbM family methyltransferase